MKRTVVRLTIRLLLLLGPGAVIGLAPETAGYATETNPLKVYGDDRPALRTAIGYWNGLAGKELFRYAGERTDRADPSTVTVGLGDLEETIAAQAVGVVGSTPISVTVRFAFLNNWIVYAHELGHALGFDDHDTEGDTSPYDGVMSYVDMWDHPNAEADRRLVRER